MSADGGIEVSTLLMSLATAVGGIGGLTGIAALVNSKTERFAKKADATEAITQAATALVGPLQQEIGRLSGRVEVLEAEKDRRDAREREEANLRAVHEQWDRDTIAAAEAAGITLTPPPPLTLPTPELEPAAPAPATEGQ